MSSRQRLTFLGIAAVIAVVAIVVIVVASGGSSSSTAATGPVKVVVKHGEPVGGVKKIEVTQGEPIRFSVTSDTADEVHVHGFNYHKDVKKGGTISFDFPAKITGVFEVELEAAKVQLLSLRIDPK
jgi:hypothetical protein